MNRNDYRKLAVAVVFAFVVQNSFAQSFTVDVPLRQSPSEQLTLAQELGRAIPRAADGPARRVAAGRAAAAASLVAVYWKDDARATTRAAALQADFFMAGGMPVNAVQCLEAALRGDPADMEVGLNTRLGVAYSQLGNRIKAEQAFSAAERSPIFARREMEAMQELKAAAKYFEQTGQSTEAAKRYRQLAQAESVAIDTRFAYALLSVRMNVQGKSPNEARRDVATAEALMRRAKAEVPSQFVDHLEKELIKLKTRLGDN